MKFNREKYKVYTWKNVLLLHWVINPGLVFNELILGQRVAKVSLVEKHSNLPRFRRTYVPCPHCHTLHHGSTWSIQNGTAFMNWFGLYCPACGNIIPCLMNGLSFIVLAITYPIWGWFKEGMKKIWLKKQAKRFENIEVDTISDPYQGNGWIKQGLGWGLFMYFFTVFIFPLLDGEEISEPKILIGIPIWVVAGLSFGRTMKYIVEKKGKEKTTESSGEEFS